jgi:hypothetical protein
MLTILVAVEARNLTPLPGDVDFTVGAVRARPAGGYVVGTGRARGRQTALDFGA